MNAHFGLAFNTDEGTPDAPLTYERSTYRRSRGADSVATIAALGMGVAAVAAFAFISPVFVKKDRRDTTVVTMMELPDDPPPAEETPPPPAQDMPPPQPAIVAPAPVVALNTAPVIAAPPPVPQPAPLTPKAPPPAPAVIAKGPENMGDMSAQVVFKRPIRVPLESRRAHEEGIVILSILLGTDGRVSDISITTSSGFSRLDRAALDAVRDWRWSPLVRNGNPVMVRGLVRIPFIREGGPHGRGGRFGPDGRDGPDGHHGRGPRGDRDDGPRGDRHGDDDDGPAPDDRT
ncbi:energy transducer TonB [Sphingobium nicotianae]|uniref:Energy transducer TonB n=1 Tax=Sphingobium nicotianae TaxID=2782607 RepID=A0A9X1DB75_9SPHN|nr:energy transducer TonB [Sphingobium nicotianae]MBT2186827.1 energy transducer TonB [Sphingobium nicotianae]